MKRTHHFNIARGGIQQILPEAEAQRLQQPPEAPPHRHREPIRPEKKTAAEQPRRSRFQRG